MQKYTLHRLGLLSLLKFGFVTGLIAAFPVISFVMLVVWRSAIEALDWLSDYEIVIPINLLVIDEISINVLEILEGWRPLDYLEAFASLNWGQVLIYIFTITFLTGIWTALVGFISGLAFNILAWLTGGLQFTATNARVQPVEITSQTSPEYSSRKPLRPKGPYLEIKSPVQRVLPISSQTTLIGSDPGCVFRLDGLQPKHAQLTYENGRYILRDFSQGNTMVQGHIVDGANMVKDGFHIQLGPYIMVFHYQG